MRRRSKWPLLTLVNAIFYVCGEGVKWRALPADFGVPWQTVYWYFGKWRTDGSWAALNETLVLERRARAGAAPLPATLIIDSQTVKNAATATGRTGVDGGKKIKGRKRLVLTDGAGNLLAASVFAANRHDGAAAARWWRTCLGRNPLLAAVTVIYADHHFGASFKKAVERDGITLEVSTETVGKKTARTPMPVHKKRWVVERSFAWTDASRRLSKDYERRTDSAEAFLLISSASRLLRNPLPLQ